MKKIPLDQKEQELLEAFEAGEFKSNMTPYRKIFIEQLAAQTFKKNKKINIPNIGTKSHPNSINL